MRTLPVELIQSVKQTVSAKNDERGESRREEKITIVFHRNNTIEMKGTVHPKIINKNLSLLSHPHFIPIQVILCNCKLTFLVTINAF